MRKIKIHHIKNTFLLLIALGFFVASGVFIWIAQLEIPTLDGFDEKQLAQSTKIYDRTGEVLLFDLHADARRTVVPLGDMARHIKNATVAIEDAEFYQHGGIRPVRTLKAIYDNLTEGDLLGGQGGSTITQQVVKNTLLTKDKTITRKVKEWILAIKLEHLLDKDHILELYLNGNPYGGNIYGIEEAALHFFSKHASDLTLTESVYLAALPQAPSYFSPYGNHIDALEKRKNLVLSQMLKLGYITQEEHDQARDTEVVFEQYGDTNIKAPHFVFFVQEYLEQQYGKDAVYEDGFKVITTLNYDLQSAAETIVNKYALQNAEKFNATNAAAAAVDPKTGQILAMVGSRDYFDEDIDGKYNVTTALRQPGSTFKPFVYAASFEKGYTPDTVVFDLHTQFSTTCAPDDTSSEGTCYSPVNYDDTFRGPITFRDALAQSINVPAVKALYLVGIEPAIDMAHRLGITSLEGGAKRFGLSLVLGGGEVSLLDLTSAYSVFANDGTRNPYTAILKIEDAHGKVVEEYEQNDSQVIGENVARQISSILSDNVARLPAYGASSPLFFTDRDVAAKTGTTNDYRDVWVVGYTPTVAIGTWGGNNDNTPIEKKVAGFVLAPMWREIMDAALLLVPSENFTPPAQPDASLKPILRGFWQNYSEDGSASVHSILHFVDKNDPTGPAPQNPYADGQYLLWEYPVAQWLSRNTVGVSVGSAHINPGMQVQTLSPTSISITNPAQGSVHNVGEVINTTLSYPPYLSVSQIAYYLDGTFLGSASKAPFSSTFAAPAPGTHTLEAVVSSSNYGTQAIHTTFSVQ